MPLASLVGAIFAVYEHEGDLMGMTLELYEEAWRRMRKGDLEELTYLCDPAFTLMLPGIGAVDVEGMQQVVLNWREGFSDFGQTRQVLQIIESGDALAVRHQMTVTHDGPFDTPVGLIEATGKTLKMVSADFVTVRNGKILEWVVIFDSAELMAQLQG
jgi:ketosteroid isomerase-like protein